MNPEPSQKIHQILSHYWGHSSFRPLQEDIILSVLDGNDTLALLPTGGGKSVCFQVPAIAKEGICIVVSPLIALMKDQVENLRKKGINASLIISGMSRKEIDVALDNCVYGNVKFLYVSPERLTTDLFIERVKKMKVCLWAVDEAHCISQWGYDFRPSYLTISEIRKFHPKIPVIALTATATIEVREDIQEKLLFQEKNYFQASYARENLSYVVFYEENKLQRLLNIINKTSGTGIIYVRNRRKTQDIAEFLRKNRISADFYHAGLSTEERSRKQDQWIAGKTRIIVATNAFGMGIDKPDVRLVVHLDIPDNLEAYYQEAGRGGRDGKKSYAVLLYNNSDIIDFQDRLIQNFPELEEVRRTYQALANYYQIAIGAGEGVSFDFNIGVFSTTFNLNPIVVFSCLHILELEGLISLTEAVFIPSRINILLSNNDLYTFLVTNAKFDFFIKVILRSYSRTFENYVNINEYDIAKRAKIGHSQVIKMLEQLDKMEVISYQSQKDSAQITFTSPRLDASNLKISREVYDERKKRYISKMDSIIQYVENQEQCRSQVLLAYFSELDGKPCGVCDICLERNKLLTSEEEIENVKKFISELLSKGDYTLHEIIQKIGSVNEDKLIKIIQILIDSETFKLTSDNYLVFVDTK